MGGQNISTSHKKPRHGELTAQQKAENKVFSSHRIFVEHLIRLVKIFRIATERFRLHPDTYFSGNSHCLWFSQIPNRFLSFANFIVVFKSRYVMN